MRNQIKSLTPVLFLAGLLLSCVEDKDGQASLPTEISGVVQKGPFIQGTNILLSELTSSLGQTGRVFTTNIRNDQGLFELNQINLTSNYLELTASGYYYNEVEGGLSSGPLTLSAIVDVTDKTTLNVNVLTHLEKQRVFNLISQGKSFSAAKKQSKEELIDFFGFGTASDVNFENFDLTENSANGGMLLAASIILQGNRSTAEVVELLSVFQNDFADNGIIDNQSLTETLRTESYTLNWQDIRTKLEARNQQFNLSQSIADFEQFLTAFIFPVNGPPVFRRSSNGVTCICENVRPGDKGIIDGIEYEAVDTQLLRIRRSEDADMTKLCTSLVTDMSFLFYELNFNQEIRTWDVSKVVNMEWMFYKSPFNQNIGIWDVSKVRDMSYMFNRSQFNQDISSWNTSQVIKMNSMFAASPFNKNINEWDVSNVEEMAGMFEGTPFNQPLERWNVGKVWYMSRMFSKSAFNQPLNNWNISSVIWLQAMFEESQFNQPIHSWNTSKVNNMGDLFYKSAFNQDISSWNVREVGNMNRMFAFTSFNHNISGWDVSNANSMESMFESSPFNQPIGNWNVRKVGDMKSMFKNCSNFNQDLSKWCVSNKPEKPQDFDTNTPQWTLPKPIWGTCPN